MDIAKAVSARSTCLRRHYGAVIVKDDVIISTGYNGSARGEPNCCDVGTCWRKEHNIPHGEQYEKCVAAHAEANAIIFASYPSCRGATLYLYGYDCENDEEIDAKPCLNCQKLIRNACIERVVSRDSEKYVF